MERFRVRQGGGTLRRIVTAAEWEVNMGKFQIPSLGREVKENYIARCHENSQMRTLRNLIAEGKVSSVPYGRLPRTEVHGDFCGSYRDEDGILCAAYSGTNGHMMGVGGTGSGKTTGCVEPEIRFLSSKKNKPCFTITDPKGELFMRNAKHLREQGYRIYLINFKDVVHSDCWNPLLEIYDSWMRQKGLEEKLTFHEDGASMDAYALQDSRECFGRRAGFWSVDDKAFPDREAAQCYITLAKSVILSETEDRIHQLVHALIPDSMYAKNDPSWFMGAQEILKGLIYLCLEDALDERSGFTRDNMNLMTVRDYYSAIRGEAVNVANNGVKPLLSTNKLQHKRQLDESIKHMRAYFENAPSTTRSYLGCFENGMQNWFNAKIYTICNGDTIKLDDAEDRPFAIFMITRDYEKSDFTVAGLFIESVYRQMLQKAEKNGGSLAREMFFLLDEFGNIPQIRDFENKIATARSRNIWFHMFVQSYAQLDVVYGSQCSQIIRDNCYIHTFLGSQNFDTKSTFSKECGKQIVPKLSSVLNPDDSQVQEVPLLPISALESLEPGQMYVRRSGLPLIETHFERSYLCKEFAQDGSATPEDMGIESLPFNSEQYRYAYLFSPLSMREFASGRRPEKALDAFPNCLRD